jgi:hypothetical protein
MARSRNIKPGFFTNEDLAECSPWARLCFAGLWTLADREGRLEDRPKRIKGQLFSFDSIEVEPLLAELASHGFIQRYLVEDVCYIQILEFPKHQNPHHKEAKSVIPSPQSLGLLSHAKGDEPKALPPSHDAKASDEPETLGSIHALSSRQNRADSLIPSSLIPDSRSLEQQAARSRSNRADRFDEFWSEYPVKKGRAEAESKWKRRNLDAIADQIIADVKRRKAEDRQWLDGFAPHGSTYVNGKGWEDAIEPVRDSQTAAGDDHLAYMVGAL